jgi:hypothetical protein
MQFSGVSHRTEKGGRRMRRKILLLLVHTLLLIAGLLMSGCSLVADGGSGGSEITNGFVVAQNGEALGGVTVTAYPQRFIAGHYSVSTVLQTETNADGAFTIAIDSGAYNLFIIDTATGIGAAVFDVGPRDELGSIALKQLGAISGTLLFSDERPDGVAVYCLGTPYLNELYPSDPVFRFELVPAGNYTLSYAKLPKVGCTPGIDCLPGGGVTDSTGEQGQVTVTAGSETVVDTTINTADLGELP